MSIAKLKFLLLGSNVFVVMALAGLILWVVQDMRNFRSEEARLAFDRPVDVVVKGKSGPSKSAYASLISLRIGPEIVIIDDPRPTEDPNWERGFALKWKIFSRPMTYSDPMKNWAILQDTTGVQRRCLVAPADMTVDTLKGLVRKSEDGKIAATQGGMSSAYAEARLLDDNAGLIAMIAMIDSEGITLQNAEGKTARLLYEKPDYKGPLEDSASTTLGKGLKASGSGVRSMPTQTVPVGPNEWDVGEGDQLDFAENYAVYIDEVNLRPHYDQRTRKLEGMQVRAKVPSPRVSRFGIRNRDVIIKVNGTTVTSAGQINDLITQNRDASVLDVEILRNNQHINLKYNLTAGGGARKPATGGAPAQGAPPAVKMPGK